MLSMAVVGVATVTLEAQAETAVVHSLVLVQAAVEPMTLGVPVVVEARGERIQVAAEGRLELAEAQAEMVTIIRSVVAMEQAAALALLVAAQEARVESEVRQVAEAGVVELLQAVLGEQAGPVLRESLGFGHIK